MENPLVVRGRLFCIANNLAQTSLRLNVVHWHHRYTLRQRRLFSSDMDCILLAQRMDSMCSDLLERGEQKEPDVQLWRSCFLVAPFIRTPMPSQLHQTTPQELGDSFDRGNSSQLVVVVWVSC